MLCKFKFSSFSLNCKFQDELMLTHFFTECPLGYHSFNCSVACKFPTFGDDCQYLCNCTESSCDHKFGCEMFVGKLTKIMNNTNIKHQHVFNVYQILGVLFLIFFICQTNTRVGYFFLNFAFNNINEA